MAFFKLLSNTKSSTLTPRNKQTATMSGHSSTTPPWLQDSQSDPHIQSVLRTLAKRESERIDFTRAACTGYYSDNAGHENSWGNRYFDVKPYDRTRVIVGGGGQQDVGIDNGSQGRYINASWVRELFGGKWWIATQAPLLHTAHGFLSVILQSVTRPPQLLEPSPSTSKTSRIRTVVQLTQNVEGGKQKAHAYFPSVVGHSDIFRPEPGAGRARDSLKATLLETKNMPELHCIQSIVSITRMSAPHDQEPVIFRHIMYTAWPDHGVPASEDRDNFLAFIRLVHQSNKDISNQHNIDDIDPDPPIIVNCSAGIGRTGAFIALSSLLRAHGLISVDQDSRNPLTTPIPFIPLPASPLGPLPDEFKRDLVAQEVDSLREQRPGMVQRNEQFLLIYQILAGAFRS